ncbi:SusC/RagA family TonB-linked outer membrane protein [Pedobacter sp. HDW13]|uniref:SusC/RagA family TonB-linked outer membrane protein n=1 Tax=Pedobacter sp. HDW13 TaxID=2714940 RepID=UPI0019802581|nr:SusC/RagA family TonB-linked outer membrane protein [Pedobacter sp. HDW13]
MQNFYEVHAGGMLTSKFPTPNFRKLFPAHTGGKESRIFGFLILFMLCAFTKNAVAQTTPLINSTLTGTVRDAKTGETLPGVNVSINGTTHTALTDNNGIFRFITGQKFPYTLTISFVGYKSLQIVANGSPIEVKLEEQVNTLNNVVVVGYGTQKKSDFTGSLSSVPTELKNVPVASPDRLIQGAISGAQVTQSSGQPGGGVSIRVRGGTSINAGNEPLYVIDGFPVYNGDATVDAGITNGPAINPLSAINPADIESIDVLKDASATAIYGSRGANGVILITTKRGSKNSFSINYSGYYGKQKVSKRIALLNAREWGALKNDALTDAGKAPFYTQAQLDQLGEGTNWQGEAFRTAPVQNHSLSISSGNEKTRLLLSGNYFKQEGVILNSGFDRYSAKLNVDQEVNSKFKVGVYLNGSTTRADVAPSGIVANILSMVPVVPVKDANGNFTANSSFGATVANPIATLSLQTNETKTTRVLANSFGEYTIIEGLTAKVSLGTDIINNKQNRFLPSTLYESLPGEMHQSVPYLL